MTYFKKKKKSFFRSAEFPIFEHKSPNIVKTAQIMRKFIF